MKSPCRHIILLVFYNFILLKDKRVVGSTETNSYCRETLDNQNLKQIDWPYLKQCLHMVNGEILSEDTSKNAWRLMKLAFDTIDNIPSYAYKYMGYSLTAITLDDLRNISMGNVDVVEAFGAIRSRRMRKTEQQLEGFNDQQLKVIAQKVRHEWLGKNPLTYSEYDLRAMGEILCYLNVTDIEKIHTDALREAAEWIGLIEQCPQDRLEALANLAKSPDCFGEPHKWSKLEVSIIGNILNGLPENEISSIAKDKLHLNHFYRPKSKKLQSTNKTHNTSMTSMGSISDNTTTTDEP